MLATVLCALIIPALAKAGDGDAAAGRSVFKKCAVCHRLDAGKNFVGPSLFGVIGRPAGSIESFRYSPALKSSGIVWTEEQLDKWLSGPNSLIPGSRMTFPGLKDPQERQDVIAYLKQANQ
ncbi:MAG: cytochrome c family protein [Proteobacteria bacterium]|nr:cytochrome c family protein [Pseudomonadota bacterium]